ncbi:MAG: response regulator [Treponema sp.]|nr:response regulator [Candidatus Treponema merdequi]
MENNEKILYIANFSEKTNKLFDKINEIRPAKFIHYDINQIKAYAEESYPELVIICVSGLSYEEQHTINLFLQFRPEFRYILYGTKEECKDFHGKFNAKIIRYILTPVVESDFINSISEEINKIEGINPSEEKPKTPADERKKLLIVDDDTIFLRTLMNFFKDKYRVSVAKSGAEALASLEKVSPDLILLDYEMPVTNGPQTLQMIRQNKDFEKVPVFFLTGVSDPEQVKAALALKPEGYLLKTSGQLELVSRIDGFFAAKK